MDEELSKLPFKEASMDKKQPQEPTKQNPNPNHKQNPQKQNPSSDKNREQKKGW